MNKLQMFATENAEEQNAVSAQNDSGAAAVQSESTRASEAVKGRKIVYLFRVAKTQKQPQEQRSHLRPRTDEPRQKMLTQQQLRMAPSVRQEKRRSRSQLRQSLKKAIRPLTISRTLWTMMV